MVFMRQAIGLFTLLMLLSSVAGAGESTLLDGFEFRWKKHPHRINKIGAKIASHSGRLTLEGGTWATGEAGSDLADHKLFYARLSGSSIRTLDKTSPRLKLTGQIKPGAIEHATATRTIWLNLTKLGLADHHRFSVLLRGFSLDTDPSHEVGFTTKGIGAKVYDVAVYKGAHTGTRWLKFKLWLRIEAGKVPERWQKLRHYEASGRVHYTVVALHHGRITRKTHGYTLRYLAGIEPKRAPATPSAQRVVIRGKPGLSGAVVGLTGFDIRLNPKKRFYSGRYMRDIRVRNHAFHYSKSTGKMSFRCDGYFSNKGPISWALEHRFKASFVLIQTAEEITVTHHEVGGTQTSLHRDYHLPD